MKKSELTNRCLFGWKGATWRVSLVLLIFLTAFALGSGSLAHAACDEAQGSIAIAQCPFTITKPGCYFLPKDLADCTSTAILVNASDVNINLNNHNISSAPGSGITGILAQGPVQLSNVNVQGPGVVEGFLNGVVLDDVADSSVDGIEVRDVIRGIVVAGSRGFGSFRDVISNNKVDDLIGDTGIQVGAPGPALRIHVRQNQVSSQNTTLNPNGAGIRLVATGNNVIDGNTASNGAGLGILLQVSNLNVVTNNITGNNGRSGIFVSAGRDNFIAANQANNNGENGIRIEGADNFIIRNQALGNQVDLFDAQADCDNNIWRNNIFLTDSEGNGPGVGCIQ